MSKIGGRFLATNNQFHRKYQLNILGFTLIARLYPWNNLPTPLARAQALKADPWQMPVAAA
jgi:hypothetical protein